MFASHFTVNMPIGSLIVNVFLLYPIGCHASTLPDRVSFDLNDPAGFYQPVSPWLREQESRSSFGFSFENIGQYLAGLNGNANANIAANTNAHTTANTVQNGLSQQDAASGSAYFTSAEEMLSAPIQIGESQSVPAEQEITSQPQAFSPLLSPLPEEDSSDYSTHHSAQSSHGGAFVGSSLERLPALEDTVSFKDWVKSLQIAKEEMAKEEIAREELAKEAEKIEEIIVDELTEAVAVDVVNRDEDEGSDEVPLFVPRKSYQNEKSDQHVLEQPVPKRLMRSRPSMILPENQHMFLGDEDVITPTQHAELRKFAQFVADETKSPCASKAIKKGIKMMSRNSNENQETNAALTNQSTATPTPRTLSLFTTPNFSPNFSPNFTPSASPPPETVTPRTGSIYTPAASPPPESITPPQSGVDGVDYMNDLHVDEDPIVEEVVFSRPTTGLSSEVFPGLDVSDISAGTLASEITLPVEDDPIVEVLSHKPAALRGDDLPTLDLSILPGDEIPMEGFLPSMPFEGVAPREVVLSTVPRTPSIPVEEVLPRIPFFTTTGPGAAVSVVKTTQSEEQRNIEELIADEVIANELIAATAEIQFNFSNVKQGFQYISVPRPEERKIDLEQVAEFLEFQIQMEIEKAQKDAITAIFGLGGVGATGADDDIVVVSKPNKPSEVSKYEERRRERLAAKGIEMPSSSTLPIAAAQQVREDVPAEKKMQNVLNAFLPVVAAPAPKSVAVTPLVPPIVPPIVPDRSGSFSCDDKTKVLFTSRRFEREMKPTQPTQRKPFADANFHPPRAELDENGRWKYSTTNMLKLLYDEEDPEMQWIKAELLRISDGEIDSFDMVPSVEELANRSGFPQDAELAEVISMKDVIKQLKGKVGIFGPREGFPKSSGFLSSWARGMGGQQGATKEAKEAAERAQLEKGRENLMRFINVLKKIYDFHRMEVRSLELTNVMAGMKFGNAFGNASSSSSSSSSWNPNPMTGNQSTKPNHHLYIAVVAASTILSVVDSADPSYFTKSESSSLNSYEELRSTVTQAKDFLEETILEHRGKFTFIANSAVVFAREGLAQVGVELDESGDFWELQRMVRAI